MRTRFVTDGRMDRRTDISTKNNVSPLPQSGEDIINGKNYNKLPNPPADQETALPREMKAIWSINRFFRNWPLCMNSWWTCTQWTPSYLYESVNFRRFCCKLTCSWQNAKIIHSHGNHVHKNHDWCWCWRIWKNLKNIENTMIFFLSLVSDSWNFC